MSAPGPICRAALLAPLLFIGSCRTAPKRHPPGPVPPLAKAVARIARSYLPEENKHRVPPKDCSDFVDRVFGEVKIKLPRTSVAMFQEGTPIESTLDLTMGDLLFFSGSGGGRHVGHVAIYINNGVFIHHANPAEGVRMETLYSDYWRKHYLGARRLIE